MSFNYSWLGLIIPTLIFLAIGALSFRKLPKTSIEFLYGIAKSKKANSNKFSRWLRIFSLTATNISVLSAVLYLIDGGAKEGILIILIPAGIVFGYFWLRRTLKEANKTGSLTAAESGGMLFVIDRETSKKENSNFAITLTVCWIVVYVLFAFYELVTCAKLITPILGFHNVTSGGFFVSGFIFLIGLIYTQIGGMRSVARTDFMQIIFGFTAILILFYWPFAHIAHQHVSKAFFNLPSGFTSYSFIIIAVIGSIATQFYNPYNWHQTSVVVDPKSNGTQRQKENHIVLMWTAILSAILCVILGFVGIEISSNSNNVSATFYLIDSIAKSNNSLIKLIVIAGFFSLTISTIDSLMIALASNLFQVLIRRKKDTESSDENLNLLRIRIYLMILYCIGFLALVIFYFLVPNHMIIDVLLTLVSGVTILFPLLLLSAKLYRDSNLKFITKNTVLIFLSLFITSWIISTISLFFRPTLYSKVPIAFLIIAFMYSLFIYRKSKKESAVEAKNLT